MRAQRSLSDLGANPPQGHRMRRKLADLGAPAACSFTQDHVPCHRPPAESVPQTITDAVYHFRTPSLGGQTTRSSARLLTIFLPATAPCAARAAHRRSCAAVPRFGQPYAHVAARRLRALRQRRVDSTTSVNWKGRGSCKSNLLSSQAAPHWALPPVVTPSVNRPSSGVPLAPVLRPSQAAASLQVPPSVLRAILLPANWTSWTANPRAHLARSTLKSRAQRRFADLQGGVLRLNPPRKGTPCSTKS